ncbi:hypothetical protein BACCAC_00711 [Bacteroides caccae ATCC 43185]|nr:hypothetical protein BACCAC_00711 [Bacteroides caccae ATCC 43185]
MYILKKNWALFAIQLLMVVERMPQAILPITWLTILKCMHGKCQQAVSTSDLSILTMKQ